MNKFTNKYPLGAMLNYELDRIGIDFKMFIVSICKDYSTYEETVVGLQRKDTM